MKESELREKAEKALSEFVDECCSTFDSEYSGSQEQSRGYFTEIEQKATAIRAYIDHLIRDRERLEREVRTLKDLGQQIDDENVRLVNDREAHGRAAWEAAREDMAPVGSFFHGTYDEWQAAEQRKDKELGEG
jgi:chromosome segregation ATPase